MKKYLKNSARLTDAQLDDYLQKIDERH